MIKFEEGDWAFSTRDGFHKIETHDSHLLHGTLVYYKDGRIGITDVFPSLFTEEEAFRYFGLKREKKKVKKEVTGYVNIYYTETEARMHAKEDDLSIAVKVTGTYEVEE